MISNNNIYEKNTSLAFSKGLFGSPSFVIGEEIFFGDDRFEDAISFKKINILIKLSSQKFSLK